MLRTISRLSAAFAVGSLLTAAADAQAPTPADAVQFESAPASLGSESVELVVVSRDSGLGVRALVCVDTPERQAAVTNIGGSFRADNLAQAPTRIRIVAPGYVSVSVEVVPGDRARSYARVRLERDAASEHTTPSCA